MQKIGLVVDAEAVGPFRPMGRTCPGGSEHPVTQGGQLLPQGLLAR